MDTTFGTDHTKRVVLDVNQVISPTLAVRAGGLFQDAGIAGRNYIKDDRDGGFVAVKWTPLDTVKLYANYIHTNLHGLPDFGVPYYRPGAAPYTTTAGGPFPDFGLNRNTFYGFVNRDYYSIKQDIGTFGGEVHDHPRPDVEQQDQSPAIGPRLHRNAAGSACRHQPEPPLWTVSANPQSRYQVTENLANQTEATYKFELAGWKIHRARRHRSLPRNLEHRQVCGLEFGSTPGRQHRRNGRRRQCV